MNKHRANTFQNLARLGLTTSDAATLVRASATLSTWGERECNGEIERDEVTDKRYWAYGGKRGARTPDREKGARNRANAIIARYPGLSIYYQTDPRGCALYIIRPGDVPEGQDVGGYYSRGVAVVPR